MHNQLVLLPLMKDLLPVPLIERFHALRFLCHEQKTSSLYIILFANLFFSSRGHSIFNAVDGPDSGAVTGIVLLDPDFPHLILPEFEHGKLCQLIVLRIFPKLHWFPIIKVSISKAHQALRPLVELPRHDNSLRSKGFVP
ncbi:hypothetical protein Tco_0104248 [Tanacetum coccineum]